jgi:hypothetical protein
MFGSWSFDVACLTKEEDDMTKYRGLVTVIVLVSCGYALLPAQQTVDPGVPQGPHFEAIVAPLSAVAAEPVYSTPTFLKERPVLSAERLASLQQAKARTHLPGVLGPQVAVTDESAPSTPLPDAPAPALLAPTDPTAPGDPAIFVSSTLDPSGIAGLPLTSVNEPSVAQSGAYTFQTGNWYAAQANTGTPLTTDWNYINPFADVPDFCCDQGVVADRGRDLIMWSRLGIFNFFGDLQGRITLSASTDGGNSFCTYSLRPIDVNGAYTNQWFDYPHITVSDNYLFISVNIFTGGGAFAHQLLMRWPLDAIQTCSGFGFNYYDMAAFGSNGWGQFAEGARTTIYFGSHMGTNNQFRLYAWPDTQNMGFLTYNIPAFNFQNGNSSCIVDGQNPCARGDSRILAGWVRKPEGIQTNGEIGFMWHGHEGGGFPWPYIEAATFREDTLGYTGRPFIAWNNTATQYPFASPNARGDLGLQGTIMGNAGFDPDAWFVIVDSYNTSYYNFFYFDVGNGSASAWGDYNTNRSLLPPGTGWAAAAHVILNGQVSPGYFVMGRQRDARSINRYLNAP